jgi:hypothetical protein
MIYEKDGAAFSAAIMKIALVYNLDRSPELVAVWWECLADIEFKHVESAIKEFLKTDHNWARPATIRKLAIGYAKDAEVASKAVRINGVTYFTNPPDLERQKAIDDANRRYLEKLAASRPAPTPKQEPIQETTEQFEARRQAAIERLKKIKANREAANEEQN